MPCYLIPSRWSLGPTPTIVARIDALDTPPNEAGDASDGHPVARPDLHGTLAQQLRFLKEIERTL